MKALLPALLLFSLLPALPAQDVPIDRAAATVAEVRLSREELKKLTGPIALYPDPMIALILPASTFPSDIVLAARFVAAGEAPALADDKPWDASIRSLVHYPDVLTWMDENLEWTTQLGYAYLAQPEDVMDAIQEQRAQAQAVGNLVDTPEQRVVRDETYIRIVPANPEYIYVPYYDPGVVYYERPVYAPLLTFGYGCRSGSWLNFDLDWHRRRVYCGDWRGDWDYDRRHDRHDRYDHRGQTIYINNSLTNYQEWQGDSRRRRAPVRAFAENHDRQRSVSRPNAFKDRGDRANAARRSLPDRASEGGSGDRGKMGDDGKLRERGQTGDGSRTGERGRDGDVGRIGDRGKMGDDGKSRERGQIGDGSRIGDGKIGERGKSGDDRKPDGANRARGKNHLVMPRNAAPVVTGDGRPDRDKQNGNLKGPGRGDTKPDMRGGRSERPEVKGKGSPSVGRPAPVITGNGRPGKESSPASNARNDHKGNAAPPKPRMDVGRAESSASKANTPDRTPRVAPKPSQGPPKISSAPSVRQSSPAPRSAPSARKSVPKSQVSAASVRQSSPAPRSAPSARKSVPKSQVSAASVRQSSPAPRSAPSARKSVPKSQVSAASVRQSPPKSVAAPSARKSSPKPGASVATRKSPPKHVASAPRKSSSKPSAVQRTTAKPQAHSAPSKGAAARSPQTRTNPRRKRRSNLGHEAWPRAPGMFPAVAAKDEMAKTAIEKCRRVMSMRLTEVWGVCSGLRAPVVEALLLSC